MKYNPFLAIRGQKIKCFVLALLFLSAFGFQNALAQIDITETKSRSDPKLNRKRGLEMLKQIKGVLEERYYDPNYHGINIDERFKTAEERIKTQEYNWQIFRTIAQVLVDFNDSHTRFYPPNRSARVEYGFSMQMIGHRCFIVDVKKGSDAEAKGLKTGDEIVGVGNFAPTRENLWKMEYIFYSLDPQEAVKLAILNPDKTEREVIVKAKFVTLEERRKQREKRKAEEKEKPYKCQTISPHLIACKLKTFSVEKSIVDKMMKEVGQHPKMILDLRGNGGGYVKTMVHLAGYFFDREVKIGELKLRSSSKEIKAKSHGDKVYKGELAILVDSDSASAAEVFPRVIQIEKRGKIFGDQTAGAVMTSNFLTMANSRGVPGYETFSFFALNLTIADLIMSDGKRLEGVGVIPEIPIGPTGYALGNKSDPVLAEVAKLYGSPITPEQAGQFYFLMKKPEDAADKEDNDDSGDDKVQ